MSGFYLCLVPVKVFNWEKFARIYLEISFLDMVLLSFWSEKYNRKPQLTQEHLLSEQLILGSCNTYLSCILVYIFYNLYIISL